MKDTSINIRNRSALATLFVLLFAFYYVNNVLSVHTHIIDGKLITHSHLFSNDKTKHQHTKSELNLIKYNNCTAVTEQIFQDIFLNAFQKLLITIEVDNGIVQNISQCFNSGNWRAPPKL